MKKMMTMNKFSKALSSLEDCIKIFESGLSKDIDKIDWQSAIKIEKLCASYLNHFASAQESRYIWKVDDRSEIKK